MENRGRLNESVMSKDENMIESILNSLPDMIIIVDQNNKIIKYNQKAIEIIGCNEIEILSIDFLKLFSNDNQKRMDDAQKKLHKENQVTIESAITGINNNPTVFEFTGTLIKNSLGSAVVTCWVVKDISEKKFREESLRKSKINFHHLSNERFFT